MYLPQCSEEHKRAAAAHNVCIIEAEEKPGYDPIDWLATVPRDHDMDFVIGHGIHLGRQVPLIKEVHRECKWIQVVHTDPEELGMFKNDADSIAKGEKKHQAEVKLCELADQVVAIGPKLVEAFSCYLRSCGKDQDILNLTPGIFSEFAEVSQAAEEDWLSGTIVGGKALLSMDDLREGYLKRERERESRCRLLVMSSWPDDGVLITRWKKANEALCTNLSFLTLYPESLGEFIVLKLVIFIFFKHMVEIRRTVDIYTLLLPQCL